jgi:hypothetical protein
MDAMEVAQTGECGSHTIGSATSFDLSIARDQTNLEGTS